MRVTSTNHWCARGDESFVVNYLENVTLGPDDEPVSPATFFVSVDRPQSPLAVLTPIVDELRAKKTLALGGAVRIRDLEAEAVQALGSLPLVE